MKMVQQIGKCIRMADLLEACDDALQKFGVCERRPPNAGQPANAGRQLVQILYAQRRSVRQLPLPAEPRDRNQQPSARNLCCARHSAEQCQVWPGVGCWQKLGAGSWSSALVFDAHLDCSQGILRDWHARTASKAWQGQSI